MTQPEERPRPPAAFPCERCLIISDRVQPRHLFASGESSFRLSITVTGSTFLEVLSPFIMGPGWGGVGGGSAATGPEWRQTKTLQGWRGGPGLCGRRPPTPAGLWVQTQAVVPGALGTGSLGLEAVKCPCHSFIHPLLHSSRRHLLPARSAPGSVLGSGDATGDGAGMVLMGVTFY